MVVDFAFFIRDFFSPSASVEIQFCFVLYEMSNLIQTLVSSDDSVATALAPSSFLVIILFALVAACTNYKIHQTM
jgi:hypothetical protein